MDSREALGLGEVTWGAGAGGAEQGSQRAGLRGGRQGGTTGTCPGATVQESLLRAVAQAGVAASCLEEAGSQREQGVAAKRPAFPLRTGLSAGRWGWMECLLGRP